MVSGSCPDLDTRLTKNSSFKQSIYTKIEVFIEARFSSILPNNDGSFPLRVYITQKDPYQKTGEDKHQFSATMNISYQSIVFCYTACNPDNRKLLSIFPRIITLGH